MKSIPKIIFLLIGLFLGNALMANNEPVVVLKKDGSEKKETVMYQVVDGAVKLFYEPTAITEYERTSEDDFVAINTRMVNIYYIGTGNEVEQINPGNYKRLIKKYLINEPKLHKKLDKKNFRFEKLPSIISSFNKRNRG